ncbi:urease accessory protein UreD [Aspergillus ibericus CBS 121593]|uniref:UreD-domain-containing protein n=1 Tax=Aspergillus ibericus CBS 121593 TaxID=1448316 RepID=A0A395HC79_9EURO|nr:UreD-domain-containing protein [Aspergillus ibericus CBS 121593]RAL04755.1 UreD-domain-containing protein [Aspergillus ibericus CBS 121593]
MPIKSPFESSIAKPGQGKVVLSLLPPCNPTLTTLTYKYPLKLLTRVPGFVPQTSALSTCPSRPVHLYLLTYGGGLLPGDHISVSITLEPRTRMVVTTPQGSTKIFKTEPNAGVKGHRGTPKHILSDKSRQTLDVHVGEDAALCYLPDPAVPYKDSRYEQIQTFTVDGLNKSSLCILDWVTEGRTSRGESWDFHLWRGKNEVWTTTTTTEDETGTPTEKKKLLLRDSLILDDEVDVDLLENNTDTISRSDLIRERTRPHGVVGTLILYGPVFEKLASFIMDRFTSLPRIGARNWASSAPAVMESTPNYDSQVTFTAARVRAGFVLVKFGAKEFATAKDWLGGILREEGTVFREFGEEALFCM